MFLLIFCSVLVAWSSLHVEAVCPTIISKKEWDALKPQHVQYLNTPLDLVVIQHTVTQSCSNDQSCTEIIRDLQKTHMKFLWDIGPSFLVGGTGKLYEGRGWNRVPVHTTGFNNQSIGIAFVGTFNNQEPTQNSLDAVRALIQCGVDENRLTPDHKVVVHSQLLTTESPGKKVAIKVMSWPDWLKDVSEIKKRADKLEESLINYESRSTGDLILTNPKQIDTLSSLRDVCIQLIDNMSKLAHQTVDTVESFTRGVHKSTSLFIETLSSGMKKLRDQLSAAFNQVSGIPGTQKCAKSLHEEANTIYDTTEAKAKDCADQRVKEVENMINNLGDLSSNAINYTNIAVENTRNCTEVNFGIESNTRNCLNSVTQQTNSASNTYESQRMLSLQSIKTSLEALPAALDLCAKKSIQEAGTKTSDIIPSIAKCSTKSIPFFDKGLGGFGF